MSKHWKLPAAALALTLIALISTVAITRQQASAGAVTAFELFIDCDPGTAGVQDNCTYPDGTEEVTVDVVLRNNSGPSVGTTGIVMVVVNDNQYALVPQAPTCAAPALDCNPDFRQENVETTGFSCAAPAPDPDRNGAPSISESFIGCNTGTGFETYLEPNESVVVVSVSYDVIGGAAGLSLAEVFILDDSFNPIASCAPVSSTAADCHGATVTAGTEPTPTITPTITNTPTVTPTATPIVGGVSEILAITHAVCVTASIEEGVKSLTAATACQGLWDQSDMQLLVGCLRGWQIVEFEGLLCFLPQQGQARDVFPNDFAEIDRDRNQAHPGQWVEIIAFVDNDGPVTFNASEGTFFDPFLGTFAPAPPLVCDDAGYDPDCDGNAVTQGDGVVVATYRPPDTPSGDTFTITVEQGGEQAQVVLDVVGPASKIVIEAIDGKDTVETGATYPPAMQFPPIPTHPPFTPPPPHSAVCQSPGADKALLGTSSNKKTVLMVRALDANDNEVVGAFMNITPDFRSDPDGGGSAIPQAPTWDLGPAFGIGYPVVVCGGTMTGDLVLTFELTDNALDVPIPFETTFTVHVVESLPPLGMTDIDGDGAADLYDNCPYDVNPSQTNTDRDPLLTPGAPADSSRPLLGDAAGDACDLDDDDDENADFEELEAAPGERMHFTCQGTSGNTDPLSFDSDGDRVVDVWECSYGDPADPFIGLTLPPGPDSDGDGLPDFFESCCGRDPNNPESDGDGILDGIEAFGYGSDSGSPDTDVDGCSDGEEIASVDTNPAVNSLDLLLVAQRFGRTDLPVHDVNKDGPINSLDLLLVAKNFNPVSCVP